jgi:cytochrome b6
MTNETNAPLRVNMPTDALNGAPRPGLNFIRSPFWRNVAESAHLTEPINALHEKTVPVHKHSFWYYFGGLTLLFFGIQLITGVLLLIYYTPTAEGAHKSVEMIITQVPFGWLIRSIHSWSANALVLSMFIHMFSMFLMKSYRSPREIMWLTGILLLLIMLGFGFTGYLLPWDQTAYFATKIGTEVPKAMPVVGQLTANLLRGSKEVSGATLTRLFALHVGVLPLIALLVVLAHITLTALLGTTSPVGTPIKRRVFFLPDYVLGEAIVWLIGFAVLLVIAFLYPWQLGKAYDLTNPTEPPAGVHPEWYFMFLFQTLRYVPEIVAVVGFTLVLIFWAAVPWLDRRSRANKKSPVFTIIGIVAILYIAIMTTLAYVAVGNEASAEAAGANAAGAKPPAVAAPNAGGAK